LFERAFKHGKLFEAETDPMEARRMAPGLEKLVAALSPNLKQKRHLADLDR